MPRVLENHLKILLSLLMMFINKQIFKGITNNKANTIPHTHSTAASTTVFHTCMAKELLAIIR